MDLSYFIKEYTKDSLGQKIGLYVTQQKGLGNEWRNHFRCGAAGTKEIDRAYGGGSESNFRSRMAMYLANWISDGVLLACLTVPKSLFQGFSERKLQEVNPDDRRELYAIPGQTRLQFQERVYHAALEERGVKRALWP